MEKEGRQLSILVQNPLCFDHIVERVISFMDVEFLPSCRLICRQWEKLALPKLLQNVHKIPIVFSGQGNSSGNDSSKMTRYLSYKAENPGLIFNNFILEKTPFSQTDKFMSTVAAEITELKLKFIENLSPVTLMKMLAPLVNLKTLTLELDSTCNLPTTSPIHLYLFSKILNLKKLCLNYNGVNPGGAFAKFYSVLIACKPLDELTFGMPWFHLQFYYQPTGRRIYSSTLVQISTGKMDSVGLGFLMGQQDLKLKVLECQSLVLSDGESRFSRFLKTHKNTLENVIVGEVKIRRQEGANYQITFPDVMPKLKVFQMGLPAPSSHAVEQTGRIDFAPVNFPVQLPSLEKLILYDGSAQNESKDPDEWESLRGFFEGSGPQAKLTDLRLPFASFKLRKSVGPVFPETTSLKLELGLDQNLRKIWEMWPQLKSLDLTLNGDRKKEKEEEELIRGVRKNNRAQGSSKDMNSDSGLISIANLKDLKYFKLRMIGDCVGSLIDFNVTQALCKSPCLEFLLFNQHNITKRGTRELLKYHPLLKKVDCPVHPEVYKIQREYLPNDFIPSGFSTEDSVAGCHCSFSK